MKPPKIRSLSRNRRSPNNSNPVDRVVKATKNFVKLPQEELPPKWMPIARHREVKRREKQKQAHIPSEVFSSKRPMLLINDREHGPLCGLMLRELQIRTIT